MESCPSNRLLFIKYFFCFALINICLPFCIYYVVSCYCSLGNMYKAKMFFSEFFEYIPGVPQKTIPCLISCNVKPITMKAISLK